MPPPFCSSLSPIQNGGQRRQPACSVRPWLAACGSAVGVELTAGPFFLQVDVPHSWFFLTEATGSITKMTFVTRRKRPFLTPPPTATSSLVGALLDQNRWENFSFCFDVTFNTV